MAGTLRERLVGLLVENNILSQDRLEEALKIQKHRKEPIGDILVRLGYISHDNLLEVLSAELDVPVIHLDRYKIPPEVLKLIPRKMVEKYAALPISQFGNTITVAMADPLNTDALEDIQLKTNMEVRVMLASEKDIHDAVEKYFTQNAEQMVNEALAHNKEENFEFESEGSDSENGTSFAPLTDNEPVVKLTESILLEAVRLRTSDIFIEPEEHNLRVRYRVDGMLQEALLTSRAMHAGIVSRIKVLSNLDIAEHRIPQDGRFKISIKNQEVDFRVSVLPTYFGEKVVLRVLDKSQAVLDIERLGFEPEPLNILKKSSVRPHGMIVICGPTGSGKTTTLYSVLKLIDKPHLNIVTVEDPVEFQIEGMNQVAIRPDVNLTFGAALRSILRQDPDVIMVGEIRDSETADIAVKAALTGHLVLSTLHATTAVGAITRFVNMGIEPFLLTSSLLCAGSQRLVRKICVKCKESYHPSKELLAQLEITKKHFERYALDPGKPVFYRGYGCEACNQKGYSGRAVLLEALTISQSIKNLILKGAQEYELKELGIKEGMKTLRENGIAKILAGVTTPEEVFRVTVRDDADE